MMKSNLIIFGIIIAGSILAMPAVLYAISTIAIADTQSATLSTGGADDIFRGLATACDGGFIAAGHTKFDGNDMAIMHLGANGEMMWQKVLTGNNNDIVREVQADCENDSYLITGMSNSGAIGGSDFYVARVGLDGSLISQVMLGTKRIDVPHAIDPTPDGGYIVAGYVTALDKTKDYAIVKVDSSGAIEWQTALKSDGADDVIRDVRALSDGNYLAIGYNRSIGENGDIWVVMFDANGQVLWQNLYGGAKFEEASTILEVDDGIIVMEESASFSSTKAGWIFKIDRADGAILKQVVIEAPGWEELSAAVKAENNTILAAGETMPSGSGQKDFFLVKFDYDLNVLEQSRLGTNALTEQAEAITALGNGSYVVAGTLEGAVSGGSDIQLALLKADGTNDTEALCEEEICEDPIPTHAIVFESDAVPIATFAESYNPQFGTRIGSLTALQGGFEINFACPV